MHSNQQLSLLQYVREGNHYCSGNAAANQANINANGSTAGSGTNPATGGSTDASTSTALTTPASTPPPTNSANAKKLEWQLDLMRDFDDKRLNRIHHSGKSIDGWMCLLSYKFILVYIAVYLLYLYILYIYIYTYI